jgi:hypothetical protein
MTLEVTQSTQFRIRNLSIVSKVGTFEVSSMFDELNIFDSVMMPCMSGNILIRDAIGLSKKLLFDGSEYLNVNIGKDLDDTVLAINRTFRIYKQSDRKNINQSSEMYVLHFVSEELIYSKQQKVNQVFSGNYHSAAATILDRYLKVKQRLGKVGIIEPSKGLHNYIIPNMAPFDALNWLAQRAINKEGLPNYLFFQNKLGYNFVSLSTLLGQDPLFDVNFSAKNLNSSLSNEIVGARDVRTSQQHNLIENIEDGVYAGKFIGFDPLMHKIQFREISYLDWYSKGTHANYNPNVTSAKNRENLDGSQMFGSKISLYPFQSTRTNNAYTKENDPTTANIYDDTDNYVFQRKAILRNLMQTKVQMTLPGNFGVSSGFNLFLKMPNRAAADDSEDYDPTLYGKYLIIGTRHMIKYDKHETIVELATDSSNKQFVSGSNKDTRGATAQ